MAKEQLLGFSLYSGGMDACVDSIASWVAHGNSARWLACLNPHSYVVAKQLPHFSAALKEADWLIPDGIGIVWASRLKRGALRARITGSDIFFGVQERLNRDRGARVFFLGATEDTLCRIRERMARDYPRLTVVGVYSPPFKAAYSATEIDIMVEAVNKERPDILWVGMTAPKQELWIHAVCGRLNVKFIAAIGAVFDFYSGRVTRSHPVFQRAGLEWLPRLVREPRRLWKRTFISAPVFLWDVVRHRGAGPT